MEATSYDETNKHFLSGIIYPAGSTFQACMKKGKIRIAFAGTKLLTRDTVDISLVSYHTNHQHKFCKAHFTNKGFHHFSLDHMVNLQSKTADE